MVMNIYIPSVINGVNVSKDHP